MVHAMRAGMAVSNGGQPVLGDFPPKVRIISQIGKMVDHLRLVARYEIVLPRPEQVLGILPRRRDQRDPAGKGLEDADRRDAGQHVHVEAARDVHGRQVPGEDLRRAGIRQPPAVGDAIALQHREGMAGIADAVDVEGQAGGAGRAEQKALQFRAALAVSPVADPDQPLPLYFMDRRMKEPRIGGLVPDVNPVAPAPASVNLREGFAKGEDAVVAIEVELPDCVRVAHRPVMRVVKEERE